MLNISSYCSCLPCCINREYYAILSQSCTKKLDAVLSLCTTGKTNCQLSFDALRQNLFLVWLVKTLTPLGHLVTSELQWIHGCQLWYSETLLWSLSLYIFDILFYHLTCLCSNFYGLSDLVGCCTSDVHNEDYVQILKCVILITQF